MFILLTLRRAALAHLQLEDDGPLAAAQLSSRTHKSRAPRGDRPLVGSYAALTSLLTLSSGVRAGTSSSSGVFLSRSR